MRGKSIQGSLISRDGSEMNSEAQTGIITGMRLRLSHGVAGNMHIYHWADCQNNVFGCSGSSNLPEMP